MRSTARNAGAIATLLWLCSLLVPAIAEAQGMRLMLARPAALQSRVSPGATLELALTAGLERHVLLVAPNLSLGALAAKTRTRATAYEGTLRDRPGSWVRVTRIGNRWVGIWFDGATYYGVDNAASLARVNHDAARAAPEQLMVFRLADAILPEGSFEDDMRRAPAAAPDLITTINSELGTPATALAILPTRRLNIAVIADAELAAIDGPATVPNMLARINNVDGFFENQIGVRVQTGSMTVLAASDPAFTRTKPDELLNQLRDYRTANTLQQTSGISHLMTGRNLDGSTVGIAFLSDTPTRSVLCSNQHSASLSEARNTVFYDSLIAAHEMAHVMGAPHDTETGSSCEAAPTGFLMAAQINQSSTLSACSIEKITTVLANARCLAPIDAADVAIATASTVVLAQGFGTPVQITVNSSGTLAAENVVLNIQLPTAITATAGSFAGGNCSINGTVVQCSLGSVAAGATTTVTLQLAGLTAGTFNALLGVSASNDGLADNNAGVVSVQVRPGADISVTGNLQPAQLITGTAGTLTFTLRNAGPAATSNSTLAVTIPASLILATVSTDNINCSLNAGTVLCQPVALATAGEARLILNLRGDAELAALVSATVTSELPDPVPGNNLVQVNVQVSSPPPPAPTSGGGAWGHSAWLLLLALWRQSRRRQLCAV